MVPTTVCNTPCTDVFCAVYDYAGKADLSKGCWNPKRRLGVTTHFSEIVKAMIFLKVPKYKEIMAFFLS